MRPKNIAKILERDKTNLIEKAKNYDEHIKMLDSYICDLEDKIDNLEGMLNELGNAKRHFEALNQIQRIISDTVGFPIACGK